MDRGTLPETWHAVSPHRVEVQLALINDWIPAGRITIAAKALFPEWVRWHGQQASLPMHLVDRGIALTTYAHSLPASQVLDPGPYQRRYRRVAQRGLVGGLTAVVFLIAHGVSYTVGHHFATSPGAGCVMDYPDKQSTDVCASNNVVVLNGMRVTIGRFKKANGLFNKELRSAVSLVNVAGTNGTATT